MVYREGRLGIECLAFLTRSSDGSSGARNTLTKWRTAKRRDGVTQTELHHHIPDSSQRLIDMFMHAVLAVLKLNIRMFKS